MSTKTKVILVIIAILVPGIFFTQLFNWDFLVDLQTINYGTITLPSVIAGAIFFWGMIAIVYGIYDLIRTGIAKLKNYFKQKKAA